jgi:hypothetical protein
MGEYSDLFKATGDDSESVLRSTYQWLEAFIDKRRYSPTIFEIAKALGVSYPTARARLVKMEQRGWLSRDSRLRSIELKGIPAAPASPAMLDFNALAEMADRLAVAMAGHERGPELFALFGEAYHVEGKRIEMEAALVEAERLGEKG